MVTYMYIIHCNQSNICVYFHWTTHMGQLTPWSVILLNYTQVKSGQHSWSVMEFWPNRLWQKPIASQVKWSPLHVCSLDHWITHNCKANNAWVSYRCTLNFIIYIRIVCVLYIANAKMCNYSLHVHIYVYCSHIYYYYIRRTNTTICVITIAYVFRAVSLHLAILYF